MSDNDSKIDTAHIDETEYQSEPKQGVWKNTKM